MDVKKGKIEQVNPKLIIVDGTCDSLKNHSFAKLCKTNSFKTFDDKCLQTYDGSTDPGKLFEFKFLLIILYFTYK